jgi:integrase
VTGKVVRVSGVGLRRVGDTKSNAGRRIVPLPRFAAEMLGRRRSLPYRGQQAVIFPSTAGTLRDPNNFGKDWRTAREELGVLEITTHSVRKTLALVRSDGFPSFRLIIDE